MKRRDFLLASGVTAAVAVQGPAHYALASEPPPNILVIMTDQQSAETMSCAQGTAHLHTPAMDRLARDGVRFTHAHAANPICVPSRCSMITGRYPHETGVQCNADRHSFDEAGHVCLGVPFRDGGYDTGYVGKWHMNFSEERKDVHGFDYTAVLKANGHDPERPAALRTFLERPRKKPFFLVASYNNPHNICEWARGDRLPDGDVGTPPAADGCPPLRANHAPPENETDIVALVRQSYHTNKQFPVGVFTDTQWRQYIWAYYRMTEMVDALIGELLDDLDRLGLTENTLIVFLSDHGDCQGAHRFNQKTMFYEESVRVPFIISWRGKLEASVSDYFVQTGIDLFPTLCDFAGVTPPPGLPGQSLKPIVEQREAPPRDYIVCSNNLVQGVAVDGVKPTPHGRMVRSRRYKYCLYSQGERRESLFDIERDPGETRNIAAEPAQAEVLVAHRDMLKRYAQAHGDHLALEMLSPGYRPEPFERA